MAQIRARDGCTLFATVEGEGDALFLIPGLNGSAEFWADIVALLRQRFRVVLMDHRGAGRSERPDQHYSIELLARDAIDVLDHFGIARAHVVGHSTGGAIGQVLALDHAGRVNRLILSGSWARPDERFRMLFETRLAVLTEAGAQTYSALSQLLGFPPDWINTHGAEIRAGLANAARDLEPLSVSAARIRMLLDFDRATDLHRLAAPTLVLGAQDDAVIPFHHCEELARLIPGARRITLPGGHFFPRVDPQTFAKVVADFIVAR